MNEATTINNHYMPKLIKAQRVFLRLIRERSMTPKRLRKMRKWAKAFNSYSRKLLP